jgi:hypothetical protein
MQPYGQFSGQPTYGQANGYPAQAYSTAPAYPSTAAPGYAPPQGYPAQTNTYPYQSPSMYLPSDQQQAQ